MNMILNFEWRSLPQKKVIKIPKMSAIQNEDAIQLL